MELGRFTKTEGECRSERDRVFYWFNNSCFAKESPSCASGDPEMQSLVEATRIAAFPPAKKDIYNRDIMTELDIQYAQQKKFEAGSTPLTEGMMPYKAANLLRNILDTADSCIVRKGPSATLRFGHESCLLPLAVLMEL